MNQLQDKASLDEKTVQKVARGETTPTKKRRKRPKGAPSTLDYHHKAHKLVLEEAKRIIADPTNSYTRYEVRSDEEVMIR